jgi:hypothetical protein
MSKILHIDVSFDQRYNPNLWELDQLNCKIIKLIFEQYPDYLGTSMSIKVEDHD